VAKQLLLWAGIALLASPARSQPTSFREETFHGRHAYVLSNGTIRVSALRGGGHFGEIRFAEGDAARTVNPMRVPHYQTIEPYEFDEARDAPIYQGGTAGRMLGGYMGQLLCLPEFGGFPEAAIVEWKVAGTTVTDKAVTVRYEALLPKTQFRVGRVLTIPAGLSVMYVEEWAENLATFGRPMHWVEHATFGPPFTEPGKNFLDAPKGRWAGSRRGAGLTDAPVQWPQGADANGSLIDIRSLQPLPHSGRYNAYLLESGRAYNYFTMYHSEYPVLVGYMFPASDNPWLLDWQENQSYPQKPWDGKAIARGIEFGTTPFDEGLRRSLERGRWLGAQTFRWINAQQRLTTKYLIFLADIPRGFPGVADLQLKDKTVVIQPGESRPNIVVPIGDFSFEK
jgi:hypothetical protein